MFAPLRSAYARMMLRCRRALCGDMRCSAAPRDADMKMMLRLRAACGARAAQARIHRYAYGAKRALSCVYAIDAFDAR